MKLLTAVTMGPLFAGVMAMADTGVRESADRMIQRLSEPSTATFQQTTYNLPGSDLLEDSLAYSVEASIAPHFTVFRTAADGPFAGFYRLDITPKFVVRRSDAIPSNPVRTPSYLPEVSLHYSPRDSSGPGENSWFVTTSFYHYSNGQSGPFFLSDNRSPNLVDGSFSLWGNSIAVHLMNDWPWLPAYKSVRVDYLHHKEGPLNALYPDAMLTARLQTRERLHEGWYGLSGSTRLWMEGKWMAPTRSGQPKAAKPAPFAGTIMGVYSPRWNLRREGAPTPRPDAGSPEFSVFVRGYAGHDTYNMNFQHEIYRVDAGLLFALR